MRIAFYAPMKSPDHPVPSGDRQMARLLVKALERAGHSVEIASELRTFAASLEPDHYAAIAKAAEAEIARLSARWKQGATPDLWFCYHPYYKAPDLIGPKLAGAFDIPYVTAEASYSERRNSGVWGQTQAHVAKAVAGAALNICFTLRDRDGLAAVAPDAKFAMLPPFIDTSAFGPGPVFDSSRLVAVAMMRPGDKLDSYRMLARALERLADLPWTLSVAGDGPCREEVAAEFVRLPAARVEWLGAVEPVEVPAILAGCGIYVWPGCGEAYGLAYLEAQAAGLPVVAQNTAGVPEVVRNRLTGILTPTGDVSAFAAAIAHLLTNEGERKAMGDKAWRFVLAERSLDAASARLAAMLPKARTR
jgi:glycosyltransferase involved in cell wall biosynthesis